MRQELSWCFLLTIFSFCRPTHAEATTTTIKRGLMYDVVVNSTVKATSLSLQTVFSCRMEIPGTQYSLKEEMMFLHDDIRTSASHLHNSVRLQAGPDILILVGLGLYSSGGGRSS